MALTDARLTELIPDETMRHKFKALLGDLPKNGLV